MNTFNETLKMAFRYLKRREHHRSEMSVKLRTKGASETVIGKVLDYLEEVKYLSDERFIESFVQSRVRKLQGKRRIFAELKKRGLELYLVEKALDVPDVDWLQVARRSWEKKFSKGLSDTSTYVGDKGAPGAHKWHHKQYCYLYNQGHEPENILAILQNTDDA